MNRTIQCFSVHRKMFGKQSNTWEIPMGGLIKPINGGNVQLQIAYHSFKNSETTSGCQEGYETAHFGQTHYRSRLLCLRVHHHASTKNIWSQPRIIRTSVCLLRGVPIFCSKLFFFWGDLWLHSPNQTGYLNLRVTVSVAPMPEVFFSSLQLWWI